MEPWAQLFANCSNKTRAAPGFAHWGAIPFPRWTLNSPKRFASAAELARTRPQVRLLSLHPGTVVSGLSQPFSAAANTRPADIAAAQLLTVIDQLTPADSGHFFAYDGERLPW